MFRNRLFFLQPCVTRQMAMKSFGLAAITLGCSVDIAVAQAPTPPSKEQMTLLKSLAAQHAAVAQTSGAPATGAKPKSGAAIVSGWNFFHATNCGWFVDNFGNQIFYIFPSEGGEVFTDNLFTSQGLQISCVAGNFFGIFVTNPSSGAFNQTISYTFK